MKRLTTHTLLLLPVLCLLVAALLTVSLSAASPHMVDNADLLRADEAAALEEKLAALSDELQQDIVVVTVTTLDGKGVQRYADDYYDAHGYGYGSSYSGILLLVCISTREYAISTCGDAMDIFSGSDIDNVEDAFLEDLSAGNYADAFRAFADSSAHAIRYDKRLSPVWIVISVLLGAVVAFLAMRAMIKKHKTVHMQAKADNYILGSTFHLDHSRDVFLYSTLTRRAKPKNNSSGSRSSSGRSHGGRSGRF